MTLLTQIFGGDMPHHPLALYQVAARAAIVYLIGLIAIRVGKGRGIGRLTLLDILLGFMIGPLLSPAIVGEAPLSSATIGCVVLVAMYSLVTYLAYRSPPLGRLIKGQARVVIENGKLNRDNMRRSHISESDLHEELRLRGIDDIHRVKRAYVERSGAISVISE